LCNYHEIGIGNFTLQRAAARALNAANEGGPSPPILPPFGGHLRQNPTSSSDYELPRLCRDPQRASSSSVQNAPALRGSSQAVRLSMLSTASSQLSRYRLPAISATPDSDRQDAASAALLTTGQHSGMQDAGQSSTGGTATGAIGGQELEMAELGHGECPSTGW